MKALRRISIACVATASVAWIGGDRSEGYSYFGYGAYPIVWPGGESLRYLSPGTFPAGSDTDSLLQYSMSQWSSVAGADFLYSYYRLPEDPVVDHYDGYADTAAVPAAELDPGVLGVTFMVNLEDQWFDMDLLFSDFPEGVGWHMLTNPDCEVTANPTPEYGFSFYLVALHELGHAIGLGHDPVGDEPAGTPWFIATMNPGYPAGGPIGTNDIVELHADDRNATRFLYPGTPQDLVDIANASYCTQGPGLGSAVPVFIDPPIIHPGEEPTAWSVIENLGTVGVSNVRQAWYLSEDDLVDAADMPMGELYWDIPAGGGFEFGAGFDIPDLAAGEYYLGSMLDDDNQVAEEYEDNNDVIYCQPLIIAQLAPSFEPFSQQIVSCAEPFVGPTPQLPFPVNMAPVVWSLDNPQPGMFIDPDTGTINWPEPLRSPFLYELDIRATNDAGTSTQTLSLGVQQAAPEVVDIPDQVTVCGLDYTGPTPVLTAPDCMTPILDWSLLEGPAGMTINPSSGVVTWPDAVPSIEPYTVAIRAANDAGETSATWMLTVRPANGDFDADGDVDLGDFDALRDCLSGPGVPLAEACGCADSDADGDVDLSDHAQFLAAFTGTIIHEGACCHSDGSCVEGGPEDCLSSGGTYRGDYTTCDAVTCSGACCFYTGGCLMFSEDNCDIAGGRYQGLDTDCAEISCPPDGEGACCLADESCWLATASGCSATGGTFAGAGMSCEAVDCSTPMGACCHSDGTCAEGSPAECAATGGTYLGDDTICTALSCLGGCCYPSGGCLDLSEPDCAVTGGAFHGAGSDCSSADCPIEPTGGCCYPDQGCAVETVAACGAAGGLYMGDQSACEDIDCTAPGVGACCALDDTCVESTAQECNAGGGTYHGDGVTCLSADCAGGIGGACCSPADWSCTRMTAEACAAGGGAYEGDDTSCSWATCPEYSNEIAEPLAYWPPGPGEGLADDITLTGTDRGLSYYSLAVYGEGGGSFEVAIDLYDGCPGEGGHPIPGTQASWTVPADEYIYILEADFSAYPVYLPDTVWMVAVFDRDNTGWVVAEQAEAGFTDDLFAEEDPSWVCDYWFGGPPADYAGFWANIQCVDLPQPVGACCYPGGSCAEVTGPDCSAGGGMYQGDYETCDEMECGDLEFGACCDLEAWSCTTTSPADCAAAGGSYDGVGSSCLDACPEYGNEIDPATLSYNPGQPMADDFTLAGSARELIYLDFAVYGGGGGTFSLSAALYDGSPCSGGAMIPGTLIGADGLPDGQLLVLDVALPTPVTLPDTVWLVLEFSNSYAGWIVAEQAEAGYTADSFAMATYNEGTQQWEWGCSHLVGDPPGSTYAGMWANLQCVHDGRGSRTGDAGGPTVTITPVEPDTAPSLVNDVQPQGHTRTFLKAVGVE